MDETTRRFYDGDPDGYSEATRWNDVADLTGRFISHLPNGARILDLGCGSGRDTLAFRSLGFEVVPVDGSEGMCRITSENTGSEVRRLDFLDLDYIDEFDGVWACASLLHLRPEEIPEIDDEFAAEVSEFDTLDEYKADVKAKIKEQKAADGKRKKEDQAVEKAIANATMEIPDAMVDTQARQMMDEFAQRIQAQGLTMDQYFQFTGMDREKMMEEMKPQALKRIETRLVLEAVAKAENIEISDEKLDEELAKMAEAYKMEVDKLKEFMGDAEKKQMKEDMAVQEAVTFLAENAVEK